MTTITVYNSERAEMDMLNHAMQRGLDFAADTDRHIDIYVTPRVSMNEPEWKSPGKLEYEIIIRKSMDSDNGYFILMLQRGPGEPVEFHS
jgi:hypothetical protein